VFSGNWTEVSLANYLETQIGGNQKVAWDSYNLRFVFCPAINIDATSTINKYIGFPDGEILNAGISVFPPVALKGPPCINIWTNFTMNTIPVSHFLACVPLRYKYGEYIVYENYNNSQAALILDPDIDSVRIILKDDKDNELQYYDELSWEIILGMQSTIPEGFAPLEI